MREIDPYEQALAEAVASEAERTGVPAHLLADVPGSSAAVHVGPERTLPAVPTWVADPVKWQSLGRAERRALERHHRKVNGA